MAQVRCRLLGSRPKFCPRRAAREGATSMVEGTEWSKTITYYEGEWHEGNLPIMGVRTHAAWLCSVVFDGARAFEGVTPDLDLHCARVNDSATKLFLKPVVSVATWMELAQEGIIRFDKGTPLYIRPMYWAEKGGPWVQEPDPESTRWCLVIFEAPMRQPTGFSVTLSVVSAGRLWKTCQWMPRRDACTRTTPGRSLKRGRVDSTMPSCAICWVMLPNSQLPTSSWQKRG